MLIAITVMIGVVIPPVAMNVFGVIYRGVLPFLAGLVLCAALSYSSSRKWRPCCPDCS